MTLALPPMATGSRHSLPERRRQLNLMAPPLDHAKQSPGTAGAAAVHRRMCSRVSPEQAMATAVASPRGRHRNLPIVFSACIKSLQGPKVARCSQLRSILLWPWMAFRKSVAGPSVRRSCSAVVRSPSVTQPPVTQASPGTARLRAHAAASVARRLTGGPQMSTSVACEPQSISAEGYARDVWGFSAVILQVLAAHMRRPAKPAAAHRGARREQDHANLGRDRRVSPWPRRLTSVRLRDLDGVDVQVA
jgi:hypothetical protein